MPNGRFSVLPGFGIQTRRVGRGLIASGSPSKTTSLERCAGGTALTPSTPAVFLPWLSWVTRRTAKQRAASDFIKRRCKLWTAWMLPRSEARKMRVCRRYTTRSSLRQGRWAQSSIGCLTIASVAFPLLTPLPSA